jgi:predicted transposase YbfD/YdcC
MARRPLAQHFADLKDPRVVARTKHRLDSILAIAVVAMVCGADSFEVIEDFADARKDWFETFLDLPHGIPSRDTIHRVFCQLDPEVFAAGLAGWLAEWSADWKLERVAGPRQIAIDGKALRGAKAETFTGFVHLVGAWATEDGLILGQEVVDAKSNEIAAIPELLKVLKLQGALVTIDAAGCQKAIADQIVAKGGDYLLSVKKNQPKLFEAVEKNFLDGHESGFGNLAHSESVKKEQGHGRIEERHVHVLENPVGLPEGWSGAKSVIQVHRERTVKGKTSQTTHYYICSLKGTAEELGNLIRRHWAIENELHWVLDVVFGEDANRTRDRNASANLGAARRLAVSLLKRIEPKKSLKRKMFNALMDLEFLKSILAGISAI